MGLRTRKSLKFFDPSFLYDNLTKVFFILKGATELDEAKQFITIFIDGGNAPKVPIHDHLVQLGN